MCEPRLGERCTGHTGDQLEAAKQAYEDYVKTLPQGASLMDDFFAQTLATNVQHAQYRYDANPSVYETRRNAILPPPVDLPDEVLQVLKDAASMPEVRDYVAAQEEEQEPYKPNTQPLNIDGELKKPLSFDANQIDLFHLDEAGEYTKWREDTDWMLDDIMDYEVKGFIELNKNVFTAEIARVQGKIELTVENRKEIAAILNGDKECGNPNPHDHTNLEEAYVIYHYQIERWKERQKYSELKVLDLEELSAPRW